MLNDALCFPLERSLCPGGRERRKSLTILQICKSGDFCCQIMLLPPPTQLCLALLSLSGIQQSVLIPDLEARSLRSCQRSKLWPHTKESPGNNGRKKRRGPLWRLPSRLFIGQHLQLHGGDVTDLTPATSHEIISALFCPSPQLLRALPLQQLRTTAEFARLRDASPFSP